MKAFCLASLALSVLVMPASAQQRTFYDSSGRVTGRAATSGNTTTFYDSSGNGMVRPCSRPASERGWRGAPTQGACHDTQTE